jgi:hypothetical protein
VSLNHDLKQQPEGRVSLTEVSGELETHISVGVRRPEEIEALRSWGGRHGLKCLHIVLDRGASVSQPMLTRRGRGSLAGELALASELSRSLAAEGFTVARVKIEAAPWSQGVPRSEAEARAQPPDRYFEHHVKLLLEADADVSPLARIAEGHGAHLSRNALRVREDGRRERFVTQRCRLVGREEAKRRLDALLTALAPLGYPVLEVEEEFVVYDSNLEVDAGWIAEGS